MSDPEWLTTAEAGRILNRTARHIRNLCRAGLIDAIDTGMGPRAAWRISSASLEAFIEFRRHEGTEGNALKRGAVSLLASLEARDE